MGEAVKALVVPLDPTDPPTPDELIALCRSKLAGLQVPAHARHRQHRRPQCDGQDQQEGAARPVLGRQPDHWLSLQNRSSSPTTRRRRSVGSRSIGPTKRNALSNGLRTQLFAAACVQPMPIRDDPGDRDPRRRAVLQCRVRPRPGPERAVAVADHQGRRRLGPSCPQRLVPDDGPRNADHRPGARVLPRRRHRAGHCVRPRVRRPRRPDRLPAGAQHELARHGVARRG